MGRSSNIAQSYRLKGECANAASFYRTYQRKFPRAPNRSTVETLIGEMDACAAAEPVTTPTDPSTTKPVTTKPVATPPVTTPSPTAAEARPVAPLGPPEADGGTSPGRTLQLTGLVAAGAGAVVLGTGVFFAFRARSATQDAEAGLPGTVWDPEIQTRGERAARNAKVLIIGGTIAVATGAVLFVVGTKRARATNHVGLVPTGAGGGSLVWAGSF